MKKNLTQKIEIEQEINLLAKPIEEIKLDKIRTCISKLSIFYGVI